jgi:hypothetical protein
MRNKPLPRAGTAHHPEQAGPAPSPNPVRVGAFKLGNVPLVVVADPGLTVSTDQAKAVGRRVATAFEWDKAQLGDARQNIAPITVQITSALGPGAGLTINKQLFQVNDAVLQSPDDNTIAHELSHMWDVRHAANAFTAVPSYLQEGRASLLGDLYDREHGIDDTWMDGERQTLSSGPATQPAFVRKVLSPGFGGQDGAATTYNGELVGELFVEFLRTRLARAGSADAGVSDTVVRLGALTRSVGTGTAYEQAFKAGFGVSVAEAQSQFMKYLVNTRADPAERFRGTIFEAPATAAGDTFQPVANADPVPS